MKKWYQASCGTCLTGIIQLKRGRNHCVIVSLPKRLLLSQKDGGVLPYFNVRFDPKWTYKTLSHSLLLSKNLTSVFRCRCHIKNFAPLSIVSGYRFMWILMRDPCIPACEKNLRISPNSSRDVRDAGAWKDSTYWREDAERCKMKKLQRKRWRCHLENGGTQKSNVFLLCASMCHFQQIFGVLKFLRFHWSFPAAECHPACPVWSNHEVTCKRGDLIEVEDDKDGARKGLVISQPENLQWSSHRSSSKL